MGTLHFVERQGRFGVSLTVILLALLCLSAACGSGRPAPSGAAPPSTTSTSLAHAAEAVTRPTGTIDELVDVGSGRMHIRCTGAGDETVVLISGFTGDADSWTKVEPALAATTRVCVHDRFGTGTSDAPSRPQTFGTQARDLRALLVSAGEPGPYVLVGHSFGGPEAVMFSSLFPSDVRGVLLVDASPSSWGEVVCSVPDDGSVGGAGFRQACEMQASPSGNPVGLDGPAAFAEVASVRALGDVQLVVATAPSRGDGTAGLPAATVRLVDEAWMTGQEEWASLSTNSRLVVVPDTGHNIQDDRPETVVEQVEGLLS